MEAVVAFTLSCFVVASSSKCDLTVPLPKPSPISNIKKVSGTWYQTVSSNDFIYAKYVCGTISNLQTNSEPESITALLTKYYSKTKSQSFDFNYHKSANGYFERLKIDYREMTAHDIDQNRRTNAKAPEEYGRINFHPGENSIISDGTNYLAYVNCTPKGWAVWIFTPNKVLTTEQLLHIHNELLQYGIHTKLKLGKCEAIIPE